MRRRPSQLWRVLSCLKSTVILAEDLAPRTTRGRSVAAKPRRRRPTAPTRKAELRAVLAKLRDQSAGYSSIEKSDFFKICREVAVDERRAVRLAERCLASGDVLRHGNRIFTSSDVVGAALAQSLPRSAALVQPLLRRAQAAFLPLDFRKRDLDRVAHRATRRLVYVTLMALIFQLVIFYRLTYNELSWDVIEPVGYATRMFLFILSYAFYLLTRRSSAWPAIQAYVLERYQRRLYQKAGLDLEKYHYWKRRIAFYERLLRESAPPSKRPK